MIIFIKYKFYGNLSIQEYRKLLKSEHLLCVLDKPLTRVLPELHEDLNLNLAFSKGAQMNQDMNKIHENINTPTDQKMGIYKVKRPNDKNQAQSKVNMLRGHFGLS